MRLILDVPIMALIVAVSIHALIGVAVLIEKTVIRPLRGLIRERRYARGKRPPQDLLYIDLRYAGEGNALERSLWRAGKLSWRLQDRRREIYTDFDALLDASRYGCSKLTEHQRKLFDEAVGILQTATNELSLLDRKIDHIPLPPAGGQRCPARQQGTHRSTMQKIQ